MAVSGDSDETNTVRLSSRTTASNFRKLVAIAKARGWLNSRGAPNISRVINFLIEQFDIKQVERKKKGKRRGR